MPAVFPFRAVQFAAAKPVGGKPGDVGALVSPPYDVLDATGKAALLARHASNIVAIDLPHTPAKELGPPAAYEAAASAYHRMLTDGTLARQPLPVMFAYRQTFKSADGSSTVRRSGMACCVETVPFGPRPGGGVLAHEETFSGPKEDRFALMKSTAAQLSPIFGLHADEQGRATRLLSSLMASRSPDTIARTDDGTLHEIWTVSDPSTVKAYQDALAGEDVFVADGHHRYSTGLNYLKLLESQGSVPPDHPARRCMIVLVGMSDPGLVIWPTHRVLGGMKDYSLAAFKSAAAGLVRTEPVAGGPAQLERALNSRTDLGEQRFGLWDFATGACEIAAPATNNLLAQRFADKPQAWRDLVVAFIQYILVEQVCQPKLNGGQPVKWAFPHTLAEVEAIGKGQETGAGGGKNFAQLAVIVRPTPLQAVRDISRANVLMPQKSTFFYPKLATGLFVNPLS